MACKTQKTKQEWYDLFTKFIDENEKIGDAVKEAQRYIKKEYSFKLPEDATAYVYFGSVDGKVGIWQIVKGISDGSNEQRGYISSTEAGQLFNDRDNFVAALQQAFAPYVKKDNINLSKEDILFEGANHSSKIEFTDNSTAMSFNDFFSKNYIQKLQCENVHAIMAGEPLTKDKLGYNCFIRTELGYILKNDKIKAINGIQKHIFEKPYKENTYESNKFIADLLKATQVNECTKILYTASEVEKNGKTSTDVHVTYFELPEDTSNIAFNFVESNILSSSLAKNKMIGNFASSYKYINSKYNDMDAYWLYGALRLGELEYDMMSKDIANTYIAKYGFDSDKALFYYMQDRDNVQSMRKVHMTTLQAESVNRVAPIDINTKADTTSKDKQASIAVFDFNFGKHNHIDNINTSKNAYSNQIHDKISYTENNNFTNKVIHVKHKNRSGKTQNGPSM